MKIDVKSIVKTTAIFAVTGLCMGLLLPHLAVAFGFASTAAAAATALHITSPAWGPVFFGTLGFLTSTIGSVLNNLDKKPVENPEQNQASQRPIVILATGRNPELNTAAEVESTKYRMRLAQEANNAAQGMSRNA